MFRWSHRTPVFGVKVKSDSHKFKDATDKALFYVRKTLKNNWSRSVLLYYLDTDLYERQGKAITNFALTLPEEQCDFAQELTKDPYRFDFIFIRERYDEKDLKDALVDKGETFLMELGTYVVAVNHQMKTEHYNQTLGISREELTKLIPEEFKSSLPTIEEIEAEFSGDEEAEA